MSSDVEWRDSYGELKQRAQADLLAHPSVEQMEQLSGNHTFPQVFHRSFV